VDGVIDLPYLFNRWICPSIVAFSLRVW
jgi:hypothetical protein